MAKFEDVIEEISGKGNYQALVMAAMMLISIPAAFMNTGSVFLAAVPDSRCNVPPFDNATAFPNVSQAFIRKNFIPWNEITNRHDRCTMYPVNITACSASSNFTACATKAKNASANLEPIPCNAGYRFELENFRTSIISEWSLICNRLSLASASTSFYYVGMFVGSILGGVLSDRFGRLLVYRWGAVLSLLCGVAMGFSSNIYVFAFLRALVACASCAAAKVGVIYVVEICNARWRALAGLSYTIYFGIGCMLMSVVAYFLRDWRHLECAMGSAFAVSVVISFIVDKSPRWVYVRGKKEEAKKICRTIARRNGRVIEDSVWEELNDVIDEKGEKSEGEYTIMEMLKRPYTRFLLLTNMFVWMTTSLVYYGLTLNSGALAGDMYINNAAGGLMELMAAIVCLPAIAKFGCRNSLVFSHFLASFSCLFSTVAIQLSSNNTALQTLGVALAMAGRFGVSAAWAVMYLHTPALFATPGRSSALGAASMASRIGSIVTPFTLQLQYEVPWLTQTVFGIGAFIVACISTSYPETQGKQLPSTYEEAELRFRRHITSTRFYRLLCCKSKRQTIPENEDGAKGTEMI